MKKLFHLFFFFVMAVQGISLLKAFLVSSKKETSKDEIIRILTAFSLVGALFGAGKLYNLLYGAVLKRLSR